MSVTASTHHDVKRNCANFTPTVWGNSFLQYASESMKVDDNVKHGVQKEELKMFISSNKLSLSEKLIFIDSVERLGVSYHFEHEIEETLAEIHTICTNNNNILVITLDKEDNFHSLALLFKLLRQHGYPISSDVFERFKDDKGKFNEELTKDVEAMLALYEATQFEFHGEDILDQAFHFTSTHLKSLIDNNQLNSCHAARVAHCLSQPHHKRLRRLKARHYMSFYQQDPSQSQVMLLDFAKPDFNMLQKLHQKEVGNFTKWRKESEFIGKVPYARDRLVETYFWSLGFHYEPQFSTARMMVSKVATTVGLIDDIYDAYGTIEELQHFAEAIHRWDISPIKSLPEGVKVVFGAVVQVCNEIEMVTAKEGTSSFVMPHVKQAVCNLVKAYLMEAKWCNENYIPSYEEYMENGVLSSACPLLIGSFLGIGLATKEVFDWISTYPKTVRAASIISRFMNDMASHKFEQERAHVASIVECCMKQYGVSTEEAYEIIHNDIRNYWKDINEECVNNPHHVPKAALDCFVNFARLSEVIYENFQDRFTNAELLKHHVVLLLVDPVPIN